MKAWPTEQGVFLRRCGALDVAGWATSNHEPGYCATYGICGHRDDGDPLSCADNSQSRSLDASTFAKLQEVCPQLAGKVGESGSLCCTEEQLDSLQQRIQIASIFLVGCPACNHNFKHFFCLLTCSPDQATFTNVVSVQTANDTQADNAVADLDVYLNPTLGENFYNSCADVVYPAANVKAMKFIGGGATDYKELVAFLGTVKDAQPTKQGSPFQMNFPPLDDLPEGMTGLEDNMASCGEGALACSCGDCPAASGCEPVRLMSLQADSLRNISFVLILRSHVEDEVSMRADEQLSMYPLQVPPPPPTPPGGCPALHLPGPFTCIDFALATAYAIVLACIPAFVRFVAAQQKEAGNERPGSLVQPLLPETRAGTLAETGAAGFGSAVQLEAAGSSMEYDYCEYPASEQVLRRGFRALGLVSARRPWRTLALCGTLCLLLALGTLRLQLVTEPEKLWVGPGSQAAQEKAEYEAAFGPFYRIAQLILSTTPAANSSHSTPSGLPAIATDANLRLLFAMQEQVDNVRADGRESSLDDLCFKPFGDACATQSVLQYWGGSLEEYESLQRLSLGFCVDHWSTACRAATGAPVDPKVVLGGFPLQPESGTSVSYTDDSTAFVITYPLDPSPEKQEEAEAWEAAFLDLAAGKLTEMAASAGLQLSFSAQRSVQDELERESGADLATVATSYLLMLVYVAVALGVIPRQAASLRGMLIHGRASLALGGVSIVAVAVASALGVCGWAGLGATLIIMEVIPFLALAVGVDNVFILTMAADRFASELPPPERAAAALATAGPSMLLAAAAETAGFALGMLTSMPALQDFAACAAAAIAIDFLLQISAFPALLALDAARVQQDRYDCAPWIKAPAPWLEEEEEEGGGIMAPSTPPPGRSEGAERTADTAQSKSGAAPVGMDARLIAADESGALGVTPALRWYMRRVHAPVLRVPAVKGVVLALFAGVFFFSCAMLPHLEK